MITISRCAVGSRELFKLQLAETPDGFKQVRQTCRLIVSENASSAGTKWWAFFYEYNKLPQRIPAPCTARAGTRLAKQWTQVNF